MLIKSVETYCTSYIDVQVPSITLPQKMKEHCEKFDQYKSAQMEIYNVVEIFLFFYLNHYSTISILYCWIRALKIDFIIKNCLLELFKING